MLENHFIDEKYSRCFLKDGSTVQWNGNGDSDSGARCSHCRSPSPTVTGMNDSSKMEGDVRISAEIERILIDHDCMESLKRRAKYY